MLWTNTRFRHRSSRLTGRPFRLVSRKPLPGAKDFGEPSVEPSRRPFATALPTDHITLEQPDAGQDWDQKNRSEGRCRFR